MKKVLKWFGIVAGILLIVLVAGVVVLSIRGNAQLNQTHDIRGESIAIATDEAALARGEHLVQVTCTGCHGVGLSGEAILDDPAIGTVYAANISGLADTHTDEEIVRAIRHGVDTDGRQLIVMPAESFIHFSAEDLGAIVAYLKTVPRAGEEMAKPQLGPVGRLLLGAGMMGNLFPAAYIDHTQPFPEMPEIGANVAYGEYIGQFCTSCHGTNLTGGQPGDPAAPPAPDLTIAGELGGWSEADFLRTMREGVTPSGRQLNAEFMPYESFGKLTDEELGGLWLYLQTLGDQVFQGE